MSPHSYLGLPPIPQDLKPVTSFLQRADELKAQDPIIAYWCAYYAAQVGIALKAPAPANRAFLSSLLTALESLRTTIGPSDAVDVESASSAYTENFALRVFTLADNEDRRGVATRSTAKKFLAAATFLEVLKVFEDKGPWKAHEDKVRYAKWKAADIAKAFREGRKPTPGPADAEPEEQPYEMPSVPSAIVSSQTPSPSQDSQRGTPPKTQREGDHRARVSGELEGRDDDGLYEQPKNAAHFTPLASTSPPKTAAFSGLPTVGEESSMPITSHSKSASIPIAGRGAGGSSPPSSVSSSGSGSSKKRRSRTTSLTASSPPTNGSTVPTQTHGHRRDRTGSIGASSVTSVTGVSAPRRSASPTHYVPRASPTSAGSGPGVSSPYASQQPQPPYNSSSAVYLSHPPPPPPPLQELTPSIIAKAQKHCRFAISALDYEDAEQARKELRAALAILGE